MADPIVDPFLKAVWKNDKQLVARLLKSTDPNVARASDGLTALHICASKGFKKMASLLIQAGANIAGFVKVADAMIAQGVV